MSGSNNEWTSIFALSVLRLTVQWQNQIVGERIKVTPTSTKSHDQKLVTIGLRRLAPTAPYWNDTLSCCSTTNPAPEISLYFSWSQNLPPLINALSNRKVQSFDVFLLTFCFDSHYHLDHKQRNERQYQDDCEKHVRSSSPSPQ